MNASELQITEEIKYDPHKEGLEMSVPMSNDEQVTTPDRSP